MKGFLAALRFSAVATLGFAGVCALAGFLVAHFTGATGDAQGVGWGLCGGGGLVALVVGQSGSPGRMAAEGRTGFFGGFWGQSAALPESPVWLLAVALVVFVAGIAVIVLA